MASLTYHDCRRCECSRSIIVQVLVFTSVLNLESGESSVEKSDTRTDSSSVDWSKRSGSEVSAYAAALSSC